MRTAGAFPAALASYQSGRLAEARGILKDVLAADPDHIPALILAGVVAGQLRHLDEALQAFDRALVLEPDNASAHFNKANVLLLRGSWEEGLPHYEWRWKITELAKRNAPAPLWLGSPSLAGKTILLRSEQGLGDTLQFCRYVKWVAGLGARVILQVQRPLVTLLADLEGVSQIVTEGGAASPDCDYFCPLMSLPLAFGTTIRNIPRPEAYLAADPFKVSEWRSKLGTASQPKVGLVWSGTATRANEGRRSVPLKTLLNELPRGCRYISLQRELSAADAGVLAANPAVEVYGDELHDFSDTAALCECMDLVVSIDTSVAHLSGAIGKRTFILLQFSPAWRWLLDRDDTPWYRSATLFRQPAVDDWATVCEHVGRTVSETLELERSSRHPAATRS
jgi:hypothetical protein